MLKILLDKNALMKEKFLGQIYKCHFYQFNGMT